MQAPVRSELTSFLSKELKRKCAKSIQSLGYGLARHQPLDNFNQWLWINTDKDYADQRNYESGL